MFVCSVYKVRLVRLVLCAMTSTTTSSGARGEDDDNYRKPNKELPANIFSWVTRRHRRISSDLRILVAFIQLRVLQFENEDITLTFEERAALKVATTNAQEIYSELLLDGAFSQLGRNVPENWKKEINSEINYTRIRLLAAAFEALRECCKHYKEDEDEKEDPSVSVLNNVRQRLSDLENIVTPLGTREQPTNFFDMYGLSDEEFNDCKCDPPCDFFDRDDFDDMLY